jgi:hypothetical protein
MSDSDRCRAAAARYAHLADLATSSETRSRHLQLEKIWLEMADWTERLDLRGNEGIRRRIFDLCEASRQLLQEAGTRLH